jgi:hypothetical protein
MDIGETVYDYETRGKDGKPTSRALDAPLTLIPIKEESGSIVKGVGSVTPTHSGP